VCTVFYIFVQQPFLFQLKEFQLHAEHIGGFGKQFPLRPVTKGSVWLLIEFPLSLSIKLLSARGQMPFFASTWRFSAALF